jgi:hypothetical protein
VTPSQSQGAPVGRVDVHEVPSSVEQTVAGGRAGPPGGGGAGPGVLLAQPQIKNTMSTAIRVEGFMHGPRLRRQRVTLSSAERGDQRSPMAHERLAKRAELPFSAPSRSPRGLTVDARAGVMVGSLWLDGGSGV